MRGATEDERHENVALALLAAGALLLILAFPSNITVLVDVATTLSFLVAPAIGVANLVLVTRRVKEAARPSRWLQAWAWAGLAFLIGFAVLYAVVR